MAGRKWLRLFLRRHDNIRRRKAQILNPARSQKVNKFIVGDYFKKLEATLCNLNLINRPQRIYNIDEKGCRLTLHHQPNVLAKKGDRRVHYIASEHAENATIVACGNAIGQAIPPMVLFKGKRRKDEWNDAMPTGSEIEMTPRGSMTSEVFVKWVNHFAKFKPPGDILLIFDGASSHLDANIVAAAEQHQITLLCLPSNTTHELQPLDKSVFRSFEYHWDNEVMAYYTRFPDRRITRTRFGEILSKVYPRAMSTENLQAGFRATGIYPFNPDILPESAFAPSFLTERADPNPEAAEDPSTSGIPSPKRRIPVLDDAQHETSDDESFSDSDNEPLSQYVTKSTSQVKEKVFSAAAKDLEGQGTRDLTFKNIFPTPELKTPATAQKRRRALNSMAQVVVRDLFNEPSTSRAGKSKKAKEESWYCFICDKDVVRDMRLCAVCSRYVHEECVGLTKGDRITFVCVECEK